MTLAKNMVITCEPNGTKPQFRFFHSPESAHSHAQKICRDLNRDAYVGTVIHRFIASRKTWAAQKEAQNVQENRPANTDTKDPSPTSGFCPEL